MRTFAMIMITLSVGCGVPSMEVPDGGQEDSSVVLDDGSVDTGAGDAETPTPDGGGPEDSGRDAAEGGADSGGGILLDAGVSDSGELADGASDGGTVGPAPGIPRALSTSGHRTCVLDDMGEAWCWGVTVISPVYVGGPYTEISANCGLQSSGRVECWSEPSACIAAGPVLKTDGTPLTGVTALARTSARAFRTCAISGGQLWCWGQEGTTCSPRAARVTGIPAVDSVSVSQDDTCALAGADAWCWGPHLGATGFTAPTLLLLGTTLDIAVGGEHQLFYTSVACGAPDPTRLCGIGQNADGQVLKPGTFVPTYLTSFTGTGMARSLGGIVAGSRHSCSIQMADGYVGCIGSSSALGSPPLTGPIVQVTVGTVTALAAGEDYTCMIDDGVVLCWGSNARNQLGRAGPSRYTAVPIIW